MPHISRTRPLRPAVYSPSPPLITPNGASGPTPTHTAMSRCERHTADNAVLPVQRACWHLTAPPRLVSAPRDLPLFHSLGCCTSGCRSGHTRLKLVEAAVAALLHEDHELHQTGIAEPLNQRCRAYALTLTHCSNTALEHHSQMLLERPNTTLRCC